MLKIHNMLFILQQSILIIRSTKIGLGFNGMHDATPRHLTLIKRRLLHHNHCERGVLDHDGTACCHPTEVELHRSQPRRWRQLQRTCLWYRFPRGCYQRLSNFNLQSCCVRDDKTDILFRSNFIYVIACHQHKADAYQRKPLT